MATAMASHCTIWWLFQGKDEHFPLEKYGDAP